MGVLRRARDFAYWRGKRAAGHARELRENLRARRRMRHFEPLDRSVFYPSYKSMDELIDVDRLRSLDAVLCEQVTAFLAGGQAQAFDTGTLKKGLWKRRRPGSRVIELTSTDRPFRYFDLDEHELWKPTPHAERFPELTDFIATLPFRTTSRIVILCDERGRAVTTHRDHYRASVLHEFLWFRTNLAKPFFVTDRRFQKRLYLTSHSAWFDTVNQFHGSDPADTLTISIRVDGAFTDAFRARIPRPPINPASTPSFWACQEQPHG